MKKKDFVSLVASVKQAGAIRKGRTQPGRVTRYATPNVRLLNIDENSAFEVTQERNGLFLKPLSAAAAYRKVSEKHRKSLNKLAK